MQLCVNVETGAWSLGAWGQGAMCPWFWGPGIWGLGQGPCSLGAMDHGAGPGTVRLKVLLAKADPEPLSLESGAGTWGLGPGTAGLKIRVAKADLDQMQRAVWPLMVCTNGIGRDREVWFTRDASCVRQGIPLQIIGHCCNGGLRSPNRRAKHPWWGDPQGLLVTHVS